MGFLFGSLRFSDFLFCGDLRSFCGRNCGAELLKTALARNAKPHQPTFCRETLVLRDFRYNSTVLGTNPDFWYETGVGQKLMLRMTFQEMILVLLARGLTAQSGCCACTFLRFPFSWIGPSTSAVTREQHRCSFEHPGLAPPRPLFKSSSSEFHAYSMDSHRQLMEYSLIEEHWAPWDQATFCQSLRGSHALGTNALEEWRQRLVALAR